LAELSTPTYLDNTTSSGLAERVYLGTPTALISVLKALELVIDTA
jgi:hypothetical protein